VRQTLTIFCTAKPFVGDTAAPQRNAIMSWRLLQPRPEILLFGEGEGYRDVSTALGLTRITDVACDSRGIPILSDMFARAQSVASNPIVIYVDADVLLLGDFAVCGRLLQAMTGPYLLTGSSWEVDAAAVDFSAGAGWEQRVWARAIPPEESPRHLHGMDYFAFPRGWLRPVPAFLDGPAGWSSPGWDNRLVHHFRSHGAPVIDGTSTLTVVHQRHPVTAGEVTAGMRPGPADFERLFSVADATHRLTREGVRPALGVHNLWRRLYTFPTLHPRWRVLRSVIDAALRLTHPVRRRAGLTVAVMAGRGTRGRARRP
jgi:hypothetical protein